MWIFSFWLFHQLFNCGYRTLQIQYLNYRGVVKDSILIMWADVKVKSLPDKTLFPDDAQTADPHS
jgi:hypothetical protein